MRATPFFLLFTSLLLFLLLQCTETKRPGKGKGLKAAREALRGDRYRLLSLPEVSSLTWLLSNEPWLILCVRVRGARRRSTSDPARPDCKESAESRDVFVDCQDRRLTAVPTSQTWSRPPRHLLLARNRIKVLREGVFFGYDSVTSLDLQQNQISLVEEGAFQGLSSLTTLLLQHNRLQTLSEETLIPMPSLTYLRLYDNPWSCLCPLESLIHTLQVPSNRNLGNHARCAEPVQLKGRKLKQVNPEMLCLDPKAPDDPTGDPGSPIDPSPIRTKADATTTCHTYVYPEVRMDCSNRGLTEVPAGIPEDVVHVDLSNNSISHLKAKDFLGTKSLRTLNISHNNMQHADTGSFSGLLHLQKLDLSSNNLHSVQYGVLEDLYFLSELKLGGNPWVCDYSIHYMVYWLRLHPGVKHTGLTCHAPLEHTGESVEEYVNSYNGECPKGRQRGQARPDQAGPQLWDPQKEAQGEAEEKEEEPEPQPQLQPRALSLWKKYGIIRLS